MRISLIGCMRTRSSVLQEILAQQYNCKNIYECFNPRINPNLLDKSQTWYNIVDNVISSMFTQDNFVTKIIPDSNQLKICDSETLKKLRLNDFDKICLIERDNFFDGCSSLQVSLNTDIWYKNPNNPIKLDNVKLENKTVLRMAKGIESYLIMKKYLIENNISFELYKYNDPIFTGQTVGHYMKNDIDYDKFITNVTYKNQLNDLFEKHFSYSLCQHNYTGFAKELFFHSNFFK